MLERRVDMYTAFYSGLSGSDNFVVSRVRQLSLMFVSLVVEAEVQEKHYWLIYSGAGGGAGGYNGNCLCPLEHSR